MTDHEDRAAARQAKGAGGPEERPLWAPSPDRAGASILALFTAEAASRTGRHFAS